MVETEECQQTEMGKPQTEKKGFHDIYSNKKAEAN